MVSLQTPKNYDIFHITDQIKVSRIPSGIYQSLQRESIDIMLAVPLTESKGSIFHLSSFLKNLNCRSSDNLKFNLKSN